MDEEQLPSLTELLVDEGSCLSHLDRTDAMSKPGGPGSGRSSPLSPFFPFLDKQERGGARGLVENEMQGDVLRRAAGSRLGDRRGRRRSSKDQRMDAEATAAFPRTPAGRGRPRIAWPLQLRSDLLYARTRVKCIGNRWCLESVPNVAGDRHPELRALKFRGRAGKRGCTQLA
jgi:hypothetical protein